MRTLTEARGILAKYSRDTIQSYVYATQRHAKLVAKQLHQLLRETDLHGKVTVSVAKNVLYIGKQRPYVEELVEMVQELLVYTKDIDTYNKAMEILERRPR